MNYRKKNRANTIAFSCALRILEISLLLTVIFCLAGCHIFNSGSSNRIGKNYIYFVLSAPGTFITEKRQFSEDYRAPVSDSTMEENQPVFSFTVSGDNRPADDYLSQPDVFSKIAALIKEKNPRLHMTVGDVINGQTTDRDVINRQLKDYLDVLKTINVVNYISPGNHDIINKTTKELFFEMLNKKAFSDSVKSGIPVYFPQDFISEDYKVRETKKGSGFISSGSLDGTSFSFYPGDIVLCPGLSSSYKVKTPEMLENFFNDGLKSEIFYYFFEYNDVYFVLLNAFEEGYWGAVEGTQLEWLEKVLRILQDKKVFVFIHTPVYSVLNPDTITDGSKHVAFSSKKNLNRIRELFKQNKVDGVFSGHEHVYNKQSHDGTTFIITALSGEYPFFSDEDGGFYHFINVKVKKNSWVYETIDSTGAIRFTEEIPFN